MGVMEEGMTSTSDHRPSPPAEERSSRYDDACPPSNDRTMTVAVITKDGLVIGAPDSGTGNNVKHVDRRPSDASSRGGEGCSVQCRYVLIVLGFLGLANVYGMRVNLNVALVAMVNHTAVQETTKAQ
ncbi:hypothetical protein MTO96_043974 [Rhipicephalus appendiculatus]